MDGDGAVGVGAEGGWDDVTGSGCEAGVCDSPELATRGVGIAFGFPLLVAVLLAICRCFPVEVEGRRVGASAGEDRAEGAGVACRDGIGDGSPLKNGEVLSSSSASGKKLSGSRRSCSVISNRYVPWGSLDNFPETIQPCGSRLVLCVTMKYSSSLIWME